MLLVVGKEMDAFDPVQPGKNKQACCISHLYQKANVSKGAALWKAARVYEQMVFEHLTTAIQAWLGNEYTRGLVYPRALDRAAAAPVLVEIFKHRYAWRRAGITTLDGQEALSQTQQYTQYTSLPNTLHCWSAYWILTGIADQRPRNKKYLTHTSSFNQYLRDCLLGNKECNCVLTAQQ